MANINITSDAWTEISITSGTVQNISATADIELSAEQTDNSGVVLKPSEIYQWDNETIYARAVTEDTGALRVVNFKRATGGGGGYVLPVASASTLGGVKVGGGLDIDASGVLSAPVSYSTTEKQIGTWIDGKPLYQITIQDTMPIVATDGTRVTKSSDISSLCIDLAVSACGFAYVSNDKSFMEINSIQNIKADIALYCEIFRADTSHLYADSLFIASSMSYVSGKPCYITIQYTKTTD